MCLKTVSALAALCILVLLNVQESEAQYRGNIVSYRTWRYTTCWRCICRYWWGCAYYRAFRCTTWYWANRCQRGWTHNGNRNCVVPICRPRCANGGTCTAPNECDCPTGVTGKFCQTLLCAVERPCYPGNCYDNNKCNCTEGFGKDAGNYGCLEMEESEKPLIGRSTAILEYIRRTDSKELYYFLVDGTDETLAAPVWVNQNRFNLLSFEFEAMYDDLEQFPDRPAYVHDVELGIVNATVDVVAEFFNGTVKQTYHQQCVGVSQNSPDGDVFNCTISRLDYITLVEHGETMTATYTAYSGGFRKMIKDGNLQNTEYFTQVSDTKSVKFKFDFIAPKHCSEPEPFSNCTSQSTSLTAVDEFTKGQVQLRWHGWADESYGSGLWLYYFEVHKLEIKNPTTGLLTEQNPIDPVLSRNVTADNSTANFSLSDPGMYSILMETRDVSNNSKWTRTLALFDDASTVTLNNQGGKLFFVSSANPGTNYTWQTAVDGVTTEFTVTWANYFRNVFHEEKQLLNKVDAFPMQFADIQDDGILSTSKFVSDRLDDTTGERTLAAINNKHGIVKFEYVVETTNDDSEPTVGWIEVSPLAESVQFSNMLVNGAAVRVWVRAHDVMGNVLADSTVVRVDSTPPKLDLIEDTEFTLNVNGTFLHTSRINCDAQDTQSGVYEIGIEIEIHIPDMPSEKSSRRVPANINPDRNPLTDPNCVSEDPNICFIKEQEIDLDNCWFMITDRLKLPEANATITITAYNQALLSRSLSYQIVNLTDLSGIAAYDGPRNFRIENLQDTSLRIVWDLPDKESCYGKANILILLYKVSADGGEISISDHVVESTATYFDIGGLTAQTSYAMNLGSQLPGGGLSSLPRLSAVTAQVTESEGGVAIPVIIGIVVGLLVIIALVVVVMIFLVRRGYLHPVERARSIKKRATTRIRKTIYGEEALSHTNKTYNANYDNRQSELYIYGGAEFDGPQAYHVDRDDVTFETLIKSGHFANVYKAAYNKSRKSVETVAAKTLKENFKPEDEQLMKAKINFTGSVVGEHPNVLKFVGACVEDQGMGPFILYEFCEHGPLKDYLKSQKGNVTIELQDNLFRFGLDIARGMEYLASKNIVHRRLAARNILLTFLNEIKITGFGPQPLNGEEEDVEQGKKERIPIKWMAPECMKSTTGATEKSDVWSYAVVLWEIFSLGDDPYGNVRARDLPGKVKKGERLQKPELCDDTWYGVMKRCWTLSEENRPSFVDIRNELDSLFTQAPGEEDYYFYKR